MRKRISQTWGNLALWKKLLLLVLVAVALILGCSQPVLYFYVSNVVYQQAKQEAHMTLVQAQTYLDAKINHVLERLFYIQLDPGFSDALKEYLGEDSTAAWGSAMSVISPVLSLHKVTEPLISSLYLHTPKQAFTDGGLSVNRGYELEQSPLYALLGNVDSYVAWGTVQTDEMFLTQRKVIPVLYRFRVEGYATPCVLVANIDVRALTQYLQNIVPASDIHLLLLDNQGAKINLAQDELYAQLQQHPDLLQALLQADSDMQESTISKERYLLSQTALQGAPWHIVYAQSEHVILGSLRKLRLVFSAAFAVVLLLLA